MALSEKVGRTMTRPLMSMTTRLPGCLYTYGSSGSRSQDTPLDQRTRPWISGYSLTQYGSPLGRCVHVLVLVVINHQI